MAKRSAPRIDALLQSVGTAIERRAAVGWAERDRAAAALAAAVANHAGEHAEHINASLDEICRYAGLDSIDAAVFTAAAAAAWDPNLLLAMGLLTGDKGPGRPTVALLMELSGLSPLSAAGRAPFAELAPLRRHGLLRVPGDEVLLARRAHVPEAAVDRLLGEHTPPASLLPLLVDPAPVALPATERIVAALHADQLLVWVQCPPGAAGTAVAAAACRELDVPCLVADLRRLPGSGDPAAPDPTRSVILAALDELLLQSVLTGSVLVLAGAELAMPHTTRLSFPALPVIAVGATPWDPAWAPAELPVSVVAPRLPLATRGALWRPVIGGAEPDPQVTALRLTPEEISRVATLARTTATVTGASQAATDMVPAIRTATRRLGRNRSSKVSGGELATMDDLVLPEHTRSEVQRLLDWARYRDEVLAQGPLQGKGGKGTGICALFAGSPGTGKSLAAHVVADTLGMDLYGVDVSSMVDKYIGETEKNLERVFTEAESLNAVLFFDEADSLFGSRSEVRDAHDRYANQEVAYLLQRMEQFDGITILATNLRGNLDPAFSRRLHFVIHFPDPDEVTKRHLWDYHLSHLRVTDPADPVDTALLARALDVAGGDIRNIVLSAAYQATAEQCPVGMRHVMAATRREFTKLGRRVPADPFPT